MYIESNQNMLNKKVTNPYSNNIYRLENFDDIYLTLNLLLLNNQQERLSLIHMRGWYNNE